MRSWLAIAAVGAALAATSLWAQMRGGHAGGARVAFSHPAMAQRGGFMPRSSPRFSSMPMNRRVSIGGSLHSSNGHGGSFHNHGHGHGHHHHRHSTFFFFSRFGNRGYYYPGYYPYYPLFGDTYNSSNDSYAEQDYQLQQQIGELTSEVQRLREEEAGRSAPPPPQPPPQPQSYTVPPTPTTLVFRNGKTQKVDNYAIADSTLWVFTKQRATKIPMSQVDVAATQKANEEKGVVFQVPEKQ